VGLVPEILTDTGAVRDEGEPSLMKIETKIYKTKNNAINKISKTKIL
jgi:hypothetical protein